MLDSSRRGWIETVCSLRSLRSNFGLALLHCFLVILRPIHLSTRQIQLRASASKRESGSTVQPCGRAVSYRLHQAFACYRNNITSWTIWAHIGLLLPFSTSVRHLKKVMFWKKKKRYILSSQRHVKTMHADKRVPIELKATSLRIPLTLAKSMWISGVSLHPSTAK